MPRKICIVSGTRAEYGLLLPLMKSIQADPFFLLQIIATGAHLSPEFGNTVTAFKQDGLVVDARVEMLLSSDSSVGTAKSVGVAILGFADAFSQLAPDIVLILGDRYEILAAAQTAMFESIPIAHLHGGEITEGAIDDSIRHAITKMSSLHFVSNHSHARRVEQLGENPLSIYNLGAIGLDSVLNLPVTAKGELEADLGMDLKDPIFLVTYHPETKITDQQNVESIFQLLEALEEFPEAGIVFTGANADAMGRQLNESIRAFMVRRGSQSRTHFSLSLGMQRYFSLARISKVIVGNSSSGILEAHSLGVPSVNIGDRQKRRTQASSVINCKANRADIVSAIRRAISPSHQLTLSSASPYGAGGVTPQILQVLKNVDLQLLRRKSFYDLAAHQNDN